MPTYDRKKVICNYLLHRVVEEESDIVKVEQGRTFHPNERFIWLDRNELELKSDQPQSYLMWEKT